MMYLGSQRSRYIAIQLVFYTELFVLLMIMYVHATAM